MIDHPEDDDLPPVATVAALPAYARERDAVDLLVKVKAAGMRVD